MSQADRDRCGANSCADSDLDPIVEFDVKTGAVLKHFGKGLFVQPHGFFVDKQGNVWVTDDQATKDGSKGLQVVKFSPDGKVLLTLGQKGKSRDRGRISSGAAHRRGCRAQRGHPRFRRAPGLQLRERPDCGVRQERQVQAGVWQRKGPDRGEIQKPVPMRWLSDSQGRLFVGDRTNNRVQIFDKNYKFVTEWKTVRETRAGHLHRW